ncbi:hypothetical protein K7432_015004 [Basidiobolus ranarum]|uniref:TECPR1-like DysF domain-containing protein n=1 Tax=Basidiobolus ranarum TaxID=34480 RepID=A0ABR2WGV6_9FUNG
MHIKLPSVNLFSLRNRPQHDAKTREQPPKDLISKSLPSDINSEDFLPKKKPLYRKLSSSLFEKLNHSEASLCSNIGNPSSSSNNLLGTSNSGKLFSGLHGSRYNFSRLVDHYGPLFSRLDFIISLYRWRNDPLYSWSLLALLWGICIFPRLSVVCGPHFTLLVWIGYKYHLKYSEPKRVAPSGLKRKAYDFQNILCKLTQIDLFISIQLGRLDWSNSTETYRIIKLILFAYPFWAVVSSLIPLNYLCLVCGTICLTWHHPEVIRLRAPFTDDSPIYRAFVRSAFTPVEDSKTVPAKHWKSPSHKLTAGSKLINEKTFNLMIRPRNEPPTLKVQHTEYFEDEDGVTEFLIYEHQRKWPGLGWTTRLMKNDPYSWTDETLQLVKFPKAFVPPIVSNIVNKITYENGNAVFLQKRTCWEWIDDDWTPVLGLNTDTEGWEYSGRKFDMFANRNGTTKFTRRRCWRRKALKIMKHEVLIDYLPEVVEFNPLTTC